MNENSDNNILSKGYYNFECVKRILSKRCKEIVFREEKVGKEYLHKHGKMISAKLNSTSNYPMTIYNGKLIYYENLNFILKRLKADSDLIYEINENC